MKFIIPQNYKFKNKILGIIDYPTAIINVVWNFFLYFLLRFFPFSITTKIFIFTLLSFPILLLTIVGFNNESPIFTLKYIIQFIKKTKIYVYIKENSIQKV